jgi:hypothetical protein
MATLPVEMPRGEWPSNRLIWVSAIPFTEVNWTLIIAILIEMLTPVDQPIDKLEDLDQGEM